MCALAVLRVLVCLVSARELLYRSKPSIEVTNVNAGTPECKAAKPGPSGPDSEPPDGLPTAVDAEALPPTSVSKSPAVMADNSALARGESVDSSGDRSKAARSRYRRPNAGLGP